MTSGFVFVLPDDSYLCGLNPHRRHWNFFPPLVDGKTAYQQQGTKSQMQAELRQSLQQLENHGVIVLRHGPVHTEGLTQAKGNERRRLCVRYTYQCPIHGLFCARSYKCPQMSSVWLSRYMGNSPNLNKFLHENLDFLLLLHQ